MKRPKQRPPSRIVNLWARIKINTSKWLWENLSLVSAIILDISLMKNESLTKKFFLQVHSEKLTALFIILGFFRTQNWNQWEKLSRKNTHINFFHVWFKSKRVWTSLDEFGRKKSKAQKLQKINLTTIS